MKSGPEFSGLGRYLALGVQMVVTTVVITAIGYWLDKKTDKAPVFLIVFFFLGALGGLAVVWRALYEDRGGPKNR